MITPPTYILLQVVPGRKVTMLAKRDGNKVRFGLRQVRQAGGVSKAHCLKGEFLG